MAAPAPNSGSAALFAAVARSRVKGWDDVVEGVRPFLTQVTQRLAAQVDAFEPEIAEYARYALSNQGKQLRPALVGLAARTVGEWTEDLVTVAVIIEMVHLATLVHDDIMDGASLRRMRPTLAAKWGADVAVLVGDCLFAHALNLAAAFPTTEVSRAIARSTHIVCSGEILQTLRRRRWAMNRAEYFKMLEMKTAELFGLACDLGVMLGGGTEAQRTALRGFGLALGTAYQVYDDCLDLFGSEDDAGKSLGTDLARGKVTLPLLVFLERAQPAERTQMIGWLERWDPAYFVGVRSLVEQHHGLELSRREIDSLLAGGRQLLDQLPAGRHREALGAIAEILSEQTAALGV